MLTIPFNLEAAQRAMISVPDDARVQRREPGLEVDLHRMQLDRLLDRWEHCKRADKSAGYEEYGTACSSGV
uniref:JmjC domain-containing protein n=1 Tax=Caenorhabditis tropicalis TaxID=1561998 RepID=A0A1I7V3X5_9PELO